MDNKLLIISFSFYPYNTVSAFRMTRFAKYLPDYEVEPYIISAKQSKKKFDYPNTYYLHSLFSYKHNSPVNPSKYSTGTIGYMFNYLLRLIKDIVISPDKHIIWSLSTIPLALRLIRRHSIKTVLVTGDPFSLFIAGLIIKKLSKIKLILDYRDPWLTNQSNLKQTFYRRCFVRKLQRICLNKSDYVIAVNQGIYDELDVPDNKKRCLPNGFDPELFNDKSVETIDDKEVLSSRSGFTFLYAGKFDIHSHYYNPLILLKAFRSFRDRDEKYFNSEMIVYGNVGKETLDVLKQECLTENVLFKGETAIEKLIEAAKNADALIHFAYPMKTEDIIPMKLYDYLMLKKPIISINSDRGLITDLLKESNCGYACHNDDFDGIIKLMEQVYSLDKDSFISGINNKPVEKYNTRRLTGNLADIIKQLDSN